MYPHVFSFHAHVQATVYLFIYCQRVKGNYLSEHTLTDLCQELKFKTHSHFAKGTEGWQLADNWIKTD